MYTHPLRRETYARLLARSSRLELSPRAAQKLRWFLFMTEHDGNISLTCRHFGIARSTFERWMVRFDPRDPSSLEEASRRPRRVRRPLTAPEVVARVAELRKEDPAMNKEAISERLREEGMAASPSTVGRIISRHALFFGDRPLHALKRRAVPPPHP